MKIILLAAGRGKRFGRRTKALPKCLIPLSKNGETLLSRYLESFRKLGLKKIVIVVGHLQSKIKNAAKKYGTGLNIQFIRNKDFKKGSIVSLWTARQELDENCLIMDADVYFETRALKKLVQSRKKTAFLCDTRSQSTGEEMMLMAKNGRLWSISKKVEPTFETIGEATGIFKISKHHVPTLRKILGFLVKQGHVHAEYEEGYAELMKKIPVGYEKISGFWREMDFEADLKIIRKQAPTP